MLLSDIVMAMYTDTVRLPERLSMEIGMLLAILHANVGNEVGEELFLYKPWRPTVYPCA